MNSCGDGEQCGVAVVRKIGLGLVGALVFALIGLNVLAWSGALIDEEAATPQETTPVSPVPALGDPVTEPGVEPIARKQPPKPVSKRKAKRTGATLILAATRGDCWVEVRAGSPTGKSLYSGTLPTGRTLRFNRPRLWLRLGAASNVDIMVNGRPSAVPSGTVELTLPDA